MLDFTKLEYSVGATEWTYKCADSEGLFHHGLLD